MVHKPRRFLGDPDGSVNLVGTDAVFAVHNLPHGSEPFVHANRGILHHGPGLQGELFSFVLFPAFPAVVLLHEEHIGAPASWANHTFGPAPRHNVVPAVDRVGEVYYGFLEGNRLLFHALILAPFASFVNYIITKNWAC